MKRRQDFRKKLQEKLGRGYVLWRCSAVGPAIPEGQTYLTVDADGVLWYEQSTVGGFSLATRLGAIGATGFSALVGDDLTKRLRNIMEANRTPSSEDAAPTGAEKLGGEPKNSDMQVWLPDDRPVVIARLPIQLENALRDMHIDLAFTSLAEKVLDLKTLLAWDDGPDLSADNDIRMFEALLQGCSAHPQVHALAAASFAGVLMCRTSPDPLPTLAEVMREVERLYLQLALNGRTIAEAANITGISAATLDRKRKKHGLPKRQEHGD
jgi:hypothetical protein